MTDNAKAIERANAYRDMMNSWAWKDYQETILKAIRINALEGAIYSTEIENVQLQRGRVKCIDQIMNEVGQVLEDHS